jgi:hypothetical protein
MTTTRSKEFKPFVALLPSGAVVINAYKISIYLPRGGWESDTLVARETQTSRDGTSVQPVDKGRTR